MGIIGCDARGQIGGKIGKHLRAQAEQTLVRRAVRQIAIVAIVGAGEAESTVLTDRQVYVALRLNSIVVAVADLPIRAELADHGAVGDDVDRAAGGVPAIERALRPLEYLDSL